MLMGVGQPLHNRQEGGGSWWGAIIDSIVKEPGMRDVHGVWE